MKKFQFVLDEIELVDPSNWYISFYVVACAFCMCDSSKVKIFCSSSVNLGVHVWITASSGYCLSNLNLSSFRDAVTGPVLSLTTNHVCPLCFLDFCGFCIQWSRFRNFFWRCLLLLLTLHPCRFSFHMQIMILMRSHNRLSSLAIASVDGCCLYIIIHNSMSWRIWSKRLVCYDGMSAPENVTTEYP